MQREDDAINGLRSARREERKALLDVRGRLQKTIIQFLHRFDCVIDDEMEKEFSRVADEFIHDAYGFDPAITEEAVYQASRNVMIMNAFQMHLGMKISLTPSVFAYSMLYPYTDNFLDASGIDPLYKREANARLALRLAGMAPPAMDHRERMIDRLVAMIESEFDRKKHPLVYESLLAIHRAQCHSVAQQNPAVALSVKELLDLSIEKGGMSVVADGYLVAGDLEQQDVKFFFLFGVLLQLIDDLQDIRDDVVREQRTLAGTMAELGSLEEFTNQLLSFIPCVMDIADGEPGRLHHLIERSCRMLILEAIACNSEYYSMAYLMSMEKRSPVCFDYLRAMKSKLQEKCNHPHRKRRRRYTMPQSLGTKRLLKFAT